MKTPYHLELADSIHIYINPVSTKSVKVSSLDWIISFHEALRMLKLSGTTQFLGIPLNIKPENSV